MQGFVTRWLKLSIVALVGCGFVAVMIYALLMKDHLLVATVEAPLIEAPAEPVKRRPEEPGGLVIPHQDKEIFDLLERASPTELTSAQPLPVPAQASASEPEVQIQAVEVSPAMVVPVVEPAQPTVVAAAEKNVPAAQPAAEPARPVAAAVPAGGAVAPAMPAVVPAKPTPAAKNPAGWGVQLAAVTNHADAERVSDKLAKLVPLQGLKPHVQQAQVGGKAVYRVQFFGLESRAAAAQVCGKLGKTQPCLPVGG